MINDDLILMTLAWVLYYSMHSILLADGVRERLIKVLGLSFRTYRLLYSMGSLLFLIVLIVYYFQSPKTDLVDTQNEWMEFVGGLLMGLSIWLMVRSFRPYSFPVFFGLKDEDVKPRLNTDGMNALVRHPLYLSIFVFLMGTLLFEATLEFALIFLVSVAYIYIGAWLEEKKLVRIHGKKYKKYQSEVPMIIPSIF
jgi:protein-S-isoprenylcysteine O-methyltransferase Ste14